MVIHEYGNALHRARWVLLDSGTIIPNGYLKVEDGIIIACGEKTSTNHLPYKDHGDGVLIPALVNVHTHLELSALRSKLSKANGFQSWVQQLLSEREKAGPDLLALEAQKAARELLSSGCGVVGEISTLGLTWDIVKSSGLHGVWFREYLGRMNIEDSDQAESHPRIKQAAAGHAPHTMAPEKLKRLKFKTLQQKVPFSIHVSESEAEITFLKTGRGAWADLLSERGIDYSGWGLPAPSPVQYLQALGLLDEHTIAVHLLETGAEDFQLLKETGTQVCICPRSNLYLHQKLPDLRRMLAIGLKPCLGTDSLASTPSISLFDEMAFILSNWPAIAPDTVFTMATEHGASALRCGDTLGTLTPGKQAVMVYLPLKASHKKQLIENIAHYASDTQ
jgi:cytosine/adenosine deaminase-related metal-dependent hydrolase